MNDKQGDHPKEGQPEPEKPDAAKEPQKAAGSINPKQKAPFYEAVTKRANRRNRT